MDYRSYTGTVVIKFYGDGKLIYTSKEITGDTDLIPFEVDLNGVKVLKIESNIINNSGVAAHVGLSEATLFKYK